MRKKRNPFKRGALLFEDFNYSQVNPYILVQKSGTEQIKVTADTVKPTFETLSRLENHHSSSSQELSSATSHEIEALQSQRSKSSSAEGGRNQQRAVFFEKEEIRKIRATQSQDAFSEIVQMRDLSADQANTIVNIMEHAPKPNVKQAQKPQTLKKSKSRRRQSLKSCEVVKETSENEEEKWETDVLKATISGLIEARFD